MSFKIEIVRLGVEIVKDLRDFIDIDAIGESKALLRVIKQDVFFCSLADITKYSEFLGGDILKMREGGELKDTTLLKDLIETVNK